MSRKDKDEFKKDEELNDKEPWDQPIFDEDEENEYTEDEYTEETEEDSDTTRVRRGKSGGKNWYAISLITLLFLIVIVATFLILYWNVNAKMNTKKPVVESSSVVIESSTTSESTVSSTTESTTTESSSSTTQSTTTESSSTFADVEISQNEVAQQQQNAANAANANNTTQNPTPAAGTTVNVGEGPNVNLYRIAINNGTTVEALLQLNPGIDSQNLQNGQPIRVK